MISIAELAELKADLSRTGIYCLDVETKKTDTHDGKDLLGVAIGVPAGIDIKTYYVDSAVFATLHDLLQGKEMVGFNLAFDLQILEENGFKHEGFIWDVLVLCHLTDENEYNYSLDFLAQKYLKTSKGVLWGDQVVDIGKLEKIFGWNDIPEIFMGTYARQDVELTWKLFLRVRGEIEKQGLSKVYRGSARYVRALQHLMAEGILVDWDLLEKLSAEAVAEMAELEKVIGFPASKRKMLENKLYVEMGLPVLKATKGGGKAQDNETMRLLAARFPEHKELFRAVVKWRNAAKDESTWYEGFRTRRTQEDKIHPGLKIHGTVTGRLSCAEPNLQQMPRDKSRAKQLFIDPSNEVLVEYDYAGVELRLAAYYAYKVGGDDTLYELFRNNADVHDATAQILGAYQQIPDRKNARMVGKVTNLALLYGASYRRLQAQLYKDYGFESTTSQCEEWYEGYHAAYPGIRRAFYKYADYHKKAGYIELWNKRRCRIRSKVPGLAAPHHDAFNRLVQGGVGQILMYSIIRLEDRTRSGEIDARLCNTVHDSVWAYHPVEDIDKATAQIIELMEDQPSTHFGIPFTVEPAPMTNMNLEWKDGEWQTPKDLGLPVPID